MAVMTAKAVRHPPVIESERLVGIVSIGCIVKSVIGDQKLIIEQLELFIHGDPMTGRNKNCITATAEENIRP